MSSISEQLLQAVEIVVDKKISELQYDKTIQCKIYSIVNLDTGEYKVRYNGNIFSAFARNLTDTYKVEDSVYVNVPEGNFSGKKVILSKTSDQSLSQNQIMALKNSIFEISPSLDTIYNITFNEPIGVVAGAPAGSANSQAYVCPVISNINNGMFLQYAKNYENIRIKASFQTRFHDIHTKGNYGIEVEFYTSEGNTVPYRLDLQNFNGDPYSFSVYSEQEIVIKVQKGYLLGLKSIKLFEEEFNYDKSYSYELDAANQIITIDKENRTEPNIFVKNVSIQYVEIKDLSDSNYHLMISPVKGIAFSSSVTTLSFLGRLVYQGKDIIEQVDKYQWYVRDLSVVVGSNEYNRDAGVGWKAISGATEARLEVTNTSVRYQEKYKLVAIYNEIVLSSEIEVFNLNSPFDYGLELISTSNNERTSLRITDSSLVGDWYVMYPDGAYQEVDGGNKVNSIDITSYLQYSALTFYTTIYNGSNKLGTLEYSIVNSESQEDIVVTYIGQDTFRYDANGDITIEDSEKERTLQAILNWKEGYATGYQIAWTMKDGTVIPNNKNLAISPEFSMLTDLWVDNYNVLHYNLKQKYKVTRNDNTVGLRISTYTGQTYYFEKEILCLKDGDQGTNGTTYVVAVRPCDSSGAKLSGFQALRYNSGWKDTMQLRCYVYKDGELINGDSQYQLKYNWSGYHITINNVESYSGTAQQVTARGVGTLSASSTADTLTFYVRVQVDLVDKDKKISIYASYPIDVMIGSGDKTLVDIDDIPSYVKYSASGLTPSYYDNALNFFYNQGGYNSNIISLNTKLLTIEVESDGSRHLKPATSFIYENIKSSESNIGVLELTLPNSLGRIIHPVIMYLDTYGNEAINGWDGTALDTGNGEYVFAPQVGAGEKDSSNRFTGVVMGKDSGQELIGLYGYQTGVNTFGLMQDGRAFFGAKSGGGQIILDGRSAIIHGGDVTVNNSGIITPAANGMYLRLADKGIVGPTKAIGIGYGTHANANGKDVTEENFFVTYDGKLKATEADIHGNIYANYGQIGGKARSGGWTITTNKLYSGTGSNTVALGSDPDSAFRIWAGKENGGDSYTKTNSLSTRIVNPAKFVVTKDGYVYMNDCFIKGRIEADEGVIGGWTITSGYLDDRKWNEQTKQWETKVGMASRGNAAFWAGSNLNSSSSSLAENDSTTKFLVTRSGKLFCTNATIAGRVIAKEGEIGGWTIASTFITSKDVDEDLDKQQGITLYANGSIIAGKNDSKLGFPFQLTSNGSIYARNAEITGEITATKLTAVIEGNIAGWIIGSDKLSSSTKNSNKTSKTVLDSEGTISTKALTIWNDSQKEFGTLGFIRGNDGTNITDNIGILSNTGHSIILSSKKNISLRLETSNSAIYLGTKGMNQELRCNIEAANQHGIYARFA